MAYKAKRRISSLLENIVHNGAHRVLKSALAASLAIAPISSAAAQNGIGVEQGSTAMYSKTIMLGIGRTVIVDLPADASEIIVGDPKIANAVVRSPRKIYIIGGANGGTTVMALDKQGRQIANIELSVGQDLDELEKLIRFTLPKSHIIVKKIGGSVILTGEAQSAGDAATAVDLAKGVMQQAGVAEGANAVVNSITLRGQDQVMVKLTIAEVQRTVLKQLGVSTSATNAETLLKTPWAMFSQQNPFGLNGNMTMGRLTIPLGNNLAATMQAFERYGVSRVLAEPTVTAVSGESAKFTVGGEIPYPASSSCTTNVLPGSSPNCEIGISYKPYGVTLNMLPVVVAEGRILLHLATEVTEIDTTNAIPVNGGIAPAFRTRKNETSIELPSGASLATAGLITNESRHAINGTPGLLNLPILGALFRSRDYQRQETELLIIVTPFVARPVAPKDLVRPDDGFTDASDPQAVLLGKINKLYSSRSNPEAVQNLKGRYGFIQD